MALVIDAHHHFWDTTSTEYDYYWMTDELATIRGRFGPAELQPLLTQQRIDRTVLVQCLPSLWETEWFLDTAGSTDFVAGFTIAAGRVE